MATNEKEKARWPHVQVQVQVSQNRCARSTGPARRPIYPGLRQGYIAWLLERVRHTGNYRKAGKKRERKDDVHNLQEEKRRIQSIIR